MTISYILGAQRTPIGGLMGGLSSCGAPQLGSSAIQASLSQAHVDAEAIEYVTMGCVLPAGIGQAPARQASLGAGLPLGTPCATVNKMCGSGMYSLILTHDAIMAGSIGCAIAGGMESMSNAPYLLTKSRGGYRLGHGKLYDSMFLDGLEDAYEGELMGCYAQATADACDYSRKSMDDYAIASLQKARQAQEKGYFANEMSPVVFATRNGEQVVHVDEQPHNADIDKIPQLRPAFSKEGTVTAANSSSISDGAASIVVASPDWVKQHHADPIARMVGHSTHAQKPAEFTLAPIGAIEKLLTKLNWTADSVDLFEINEAFAVVTMVCADRLDISYDKVNICGGACALGHPIGASGARIVATLIHQLRRTGGKRGVAALCIGGGEATAVGIEIV